MLILSKTEFQFFVFSLKLPGAIFFLRLNLPGQTQVNRIVGKYNRLGTEEPMA
jgi:hypothetical protein